MAITVLFLVVYCFYIDLNSFAYSFMLFENLYFNI